MSVPRDEETRVVESDERKQGLIASLAHAMWRCEVVLSLHLKEKACAAVSKRVVVIKLVPTTVFFPRPQMAAATEWLVGLGETGHLLHVHTRSRIRHPRAQHEPSSRSDPGETQFESHELSRDVDIGPSRTRCMLFI